MPESVRFNRFNKGTEDFVTPGLQLEYVADAKPDGTAIVEIDKQGKEIKISWDGLRKLSNRIAWLLIDKGIDSDSTVIVTWPNNILHVAAMLAIWKCGACYVPIPSKTTIAELDGNFFCPIRRERFVWDFQQPHHRKNRPNPPDSAASGRQFP